MSFPGHSEPSRVRKPELDTAHDVADYFRARFSDDETFRAALEDFHEKVWAIVLGQTDTIDLYYC